MSSYEARINIDIWNRKQSTVIGYLKNTMVPDFHANYIYIDNAGSHHALIRRTSST